MSALELVGVRVTRADEVLLEIPSLSVAAAEVAVITGPTDSGKTLLASVCCGQAGLTAGTVRVGGRPLFGGPAARRRSGLAAAVADGHRIAGCTVAEALRLAGPRRVEDALRRLPLLDRRRAVRAELLSGGEHQLLQVACAWVAEARAVVLDAPTTGLAEDVAAEVVALAVAAADRGSAVVWLDQASPAIAGAARWSLTAGTLRRATEEA